VARRYTGNMNGEPYLGNVSKMQIHDLDNEQLGKNECQIDEIIKAKNDKPYKSLVLAHYDGYEDCDYCLPKKKS
jgi:hypothetical protein